MPAAIFPNPPQPATPSARLTVTAAGVPVTERFGVEWQDVLSQLGSGQFALLNTHPLITADTIDNDQLVIFSLDGDEFLAWIITTQHQTSTTAAEESAGVTVFSGETTLVELRRMVVLPNAKIRFVDTPIFVGYVSTKPYALERYFGPMEPGYVDSAWPAAIEVLQVTGAAAPEGWPARHGCYWIGAGEPTAFVRDSFTTSGVFKVKVFFAGGVNCKVDLFLDGTPVGQIDPTTEDGEGKTRAVVVEVTNGTHHLFARSVAAAGDATVAYCVVNCATGAILCVSDDTAKAVDEVAGVTVGSIMETALAEADAWDTLPGWTMDFDAAEDTDGRPWRSMGDWWSCKAVTTDYLQLGQQLCEGWAEMAAEASKGGRVLSMWVAAGTLDGAGNTGVGRNPSMGGLTIAKGVNATELIHEKTT